MLDRTATKFSHVKPGDTDFVSGGLRDFFLYRDLGIADATHGKVIAHLVKANMAPEKGTGWHRHEADFQIVIMIKGWARFMYEDKETLVEAGDVVHQRPGIRPYMKTHHIQTGVGHYGVFSGRKWNQQIYPRVREMIHASLG